MTIEHNAQAHKGVFTATDNGAIAGQMTYVMSGSDKMIIDHTEVDPAFSGKGIGKALLMELVNYVREKHIKVIPLCPFAKSVFDKTKEIRDVLAS